MPCPLRLPPRTRRHGGGVVQMVDGVVEASLDFPPDWMKKHMNAKEAFAIVVGGLARVLCHRGGQLKGTQVLVAVDNQSVVTSFERGRSRD